MFHRASVILSTNSSLETSFSQEFFLRLTGDVRNCVILTDRQPASTLAGRLYQTHDRDLDYAQLPIRVCRPGKISVTRRVNIPLEGRDLEEYFDRRRLEEEKKRLDETKLMDTDEMAVDRENEMSEDEYVDTPVAVAGSRAGRLNKLVPAYPMFPFLEPQFTMDDYGEVRPSADTAGNGMMAMNGVAPTGAPAPLAPHAQGNNFSLPPVPNAQPQQVMSIVS